MKRIFYNYKDIVFDSNFKEYNEKVIVFCEKISIYSISDTFLNKGNVNHIVIDRENSDEAYNFFIKDFKKVTAAGGVVVNDNGEVLFIYRRGVWDLPKGKQDAEEDIAKCALREVEEETSINEVEIIDNSPYTTQHIYNTYGQWELKDTYWFLMRGNGEINNIESSFQIEEEIDECRWVAIDDIDEIISDSYPTIKSVINHYRERINDINKF